MSVELFKRIGNRYIKQTSKTSIKISNRRYKSFFGASAKICSIIWKILKDNVPKGSSEKHLLWALFFLKQYQVEHLRRVVLKADESTIRKWTWIYVELLANLDVVLKNLNIKFKFIIKYFKN